MPFLILPFVLTRVNDTLKISIYWTRILDYNFFSTSSLLFNGISVFYRTNTATTTKVLTFPIFMMYLNGQFNLDICLAPTKNSLWSEWNYWPTTLRHDHYSCILESFYFDFSNVNVFSYQFYFCCSNWQPFRVTIWEIKESCTRYVFLEFNNSYILCAILYICGT